MLKILVFLLSEHMDNAMLRQLRIHRDNYNKEYEAGDKRDKILADIIEDLDVEIDRVNKKEQKDIENDD